MKASNAAQQSMSHLDTAAPSVPMAISAHALKPRSHELDPLPHKRKLSDRVHQLRSPLSFKCRLDMRWPAQDVGTAVLEVRMRGDFVLMTKKAYPATFATNRREIRSTNVLAFHHELSSFVLKKAGATQEWAAFAPADWNFTTTSEDALSHGLRSDPAINTGFLSAYGATTAENDFNVYAERIFTQPRDLVRLACRHALVRKKLLFVLETYVKLDRRMENTFRQLGIDRAQMCGQ
jgi:hypothetical protein